MKLIIEIPKDYYEIIKHNVEHHLTDYRPFEIIGNGIPLDENKGEWIEKCREVFKYYCDKCNTGSDLRTNFCPNCGADMRK